MALPPGKLTQRRKGRFHKRGRARGAGPSAPGMRLGLSGNQGGALSAFQQAPLLSFHCFAQFTVLAPGPGGRAGGPGTLCRRPDARGAPAPASASLSTRVPRPGPQSRTEKARRPPVAISGGKAGRLSGKDSRLFPSRLNSNALICFPARRGLLTSHTQKKTPPKTHKPPHT